MKLQSFRNTGFQFSLVFENDEVIAVNLRTLISKYVAENDLDSAKMDAEWGCLEFCDGAVDIDPAILYAYAQHHH